MRPSAPIAPKKNAVTVFRLALASAFSVAVLWLLLRSTDAGVLRQTLLALDWPGCVGYLLCLFVTQLARAWRWRILLVPLTRVPWSRAWTMSNVGNMMIMLLPLRLGELSRPLMLQQEFGQPLSAGLGAAVVERVLDGLLVTLLFFAATALLPSPFVVSPALWAGALLALGIFGGASLAILLALVAHDRLTTGLRRLMRRGGPKVQQTLERLLTLLDAFVLGMRALPSLRAAFGVLVSTLLYWAANTAGIHLLLAACHIGLPFTASATIVCVLVIGVMVPAGPGLLGTYQAALVAGLTVFHVPYDRAVAFSLVAYLGNVAVLAGFGLPPLLARRALVAKTRRQ